MLGSTPRCDGSLDITRRAWQVLSYLSELKGILMIGIEKLALVLSAALAVIRLGSMLCEVGEAEISQFRTYLNLSGLILIVIESCASGSSTSTS